jgi:hypothetical protein
MSAPFSLLADLEENDQLLLLKSMGHTGWSQTSIIISSLTAVALFSFLMVYIFRKKILGRHKRHHFHRHVTNSAAATANPPVAESGGKVKKRWRRSRHAHRPLNPTLAETRGLPPLREEGTPPPPAP